MLQKIRQPSAQKIITKLRKWLNKTPKLIILNILMILTLS
jgi:hypothetical protein